MSVISEVKDRLDIVEVIQPYVSLQKAGRTYKGLCPFHSEKTPSFVVFPHTGTWHCFGACNTGGDVFTFIMKQENLGFGEALQLLAERAGVEIKPASPEEAAKEQRLEWLRKIIEAAANYFHHLLLHSDEAARARSYLESRGLNRDTLDRFQVGYALNQWDGLLRYLTGKRYAMVDLAEAGLVIERDDKSGYYDRFRGRIIFSIRDHRGRAIGFGGRVLGEGVPKYLNSPQTPLFDKSSVLYGLDRARQGIRIADEAVIVEGYMDVLMAHQHGINNVVAQMGTALTETQLRQLKRYTKRFVLALDSDVAGDQATLRGLDVAREVLDHEIVPVPTARGLMRFEERLAADIRIATLPIGLDPDEVIAENPSNWVQLIERAKPVMEYYFQALTSDLDLGTARGKVEAVRILGPLVSEIGDRVQRTHYLQQLARMVQVDERSLWQQIRRTARPARPTRQRQPAQSTDEPEEAPLGLDEHCLSFVLYYPNLMVQADQALLACEEAPFREEDLNRPDDRALLTLWREWLSTGSSPDVQGGFLDTLEESLQQRAVALILAREKEPPVPEELRKDKVVDAIIQLRIKNLRHRIQALRFLHEDAQSSGERDTLRELGQLNVELIARIGRLQKATNERSVAVRRQREDAAVRVPLNQE